MNAFLAVTQNIFAYLIIPPERCTEDSAQKNREKEMEIGSEMHAVNELSNGSQSHDIVVSSGSTERLFRVAYTTLYMCSSRDKMVCALRLRCIVVGSFSTWR